MSREPFFPMEPKQSGSGSTDLCKICGHLAAGFHYQCLSCLRCKTFFRRAVLQRQSTKCENHNRCNSPSAPKLCRACRYKKCLEMGMSIKSLQPKRDIIGVRIVEKKPKIKPNCNQELVKFIVDLTRTDEKIRKKKFEVIRVKEEAQKLSATVNRREYKTCEKVNGKYLSLMAKADVAIVTQIETISMLEWTNTLTEFQNLPLDDRMILLKRFSVHHLLIEHGYYTACSGLRDIWLISNGSYMPKTINEMPDELKKNLPEARVWRQEKLYTRMTNRCIDEVANPFEKLKLMPQELITLKVIMLFSCGNQSQSEANQLPISETSRQSLHQIRDKVIKAMFEYYKYINYKNYEERFGNVILTISGIFSASTTLLETYQIMRFFDLAVFDHISEQLLFNTVNLDRNYL
ncbi:unnamed protein product [Bursaphelenchus xylophilus]|uniref:(pine wood nematode) hypothetical protein n=1 Tax=Bursaphelenchus xylophilus TaxID=6326 RepID=A0A1I7RPL6_BURXY|nr:unnamed protein product [Bursaphelenchus xylophilus]CAG9096240.1 unnamed protein product [Bursaphelenchus xylophilus]